MTVNDRVSGHEELSGRPEADTLSANGHLPGQSSPASTKAVLLIDDDQAVAKAMEIAFRMAGHALAVACGPEEAFSNLARRHYDAILLDLNFSPGKADGREGLACLERIIAEDPSACVVVLTAHGGIRTAVAAMQAGARDFAIKPWKNAELVAKVEAAVARKDASAPATFPPPLASNAAPARLLGESDAIDAVRELIRRIGPTSAGVTVIGPSGSGRTLAALALHGVSAYADRAPLRIELRDLAAWTQLDEARGTAILRHPDRLDELAQDRLVDRLAASVRPIGIVDDITRLTPALRRRIATVEVAMPPLAERRQDIVMLARHFLRAAAERFERPVPQLSDAAQAAIRTADWPDEVRGLALAMERAVLLAEGGLVEAAALSLFASADPREVAKTGEAQRNFDLNHSEKAMIEAALGEHRHNVSHAAKALGLSRGALYRRMERHGL